MNSKIAVLVYCTCIACLYSCKKIIEIEAPKNEIVTATVFSDSINAISAVNGIYISSLSSSFEVKITNGTVGIYTSLSADDLFPTRNLEAENEFYENNILTNPDNYINVSFWNSAYKIIYQVNACIEDLNERDRKSTGLNSSHV